MMMLQRISNAFRRQDWFTVVLEVGVVVVGILIALQVENRNSDRKAREEAADWRRQILIDLRRTHEDLAGRRNYSHDALSFGERALGWMNTEGALSDEASWELVLGAFQAGQIWPYRLTGPAFRQAQNAGGLGLIGGPDAVVTLSYLYDVSAHDFEQISGGLPKYRELIRERLPWAIQVHIWDSGCETITRPEGTVDFSFELVFCPGPEDKEAVRQAAAALRKDEELKGSLRGRLSQLKVSDTSTSSLMESVAAAIGKLESEP